MTPPRNLSPNDPDRLIDAFLAEGQTDLPDQVYDEVRAEIDHTSQRTFIGPWRNPFTSRFVAVGAVAAVVAAAVVIGLQFGAGSPPLVGGAPSASAEPSPVETAPPSESPSESPSAPTNSPVPTPSLPAFSCDTTLQSEGEYGHAHLTYVAVGAHEGYDRVVYTYLEDSIPGYRVESAHAPFYRDPSGLPMDVAGTSVFQIAILGGTKVADDGSITYDGPTSFEPSYGQIVQLVERGDFEATNTWYLGLNGGECLRAFTLTSPTRIVVDIQH
jgi:hypothetical protein